MIKKLLCRLGWHKWSSWYPIIAKDDGYIAKRKCRWCKIYESDRVYWEGFKWYGGYGKTSSTDES